MILLDTNVLSELIRPAGSPGVIAFVRAIPVAEIATAAICEAELRFGVARLPAGRRRDDLAARLELFLAALGPRILPFGRAAAACFAGIRAGRERSGRPIPLADALVAATALAHGLTVASRNVGDFRDCGIGLVNPWDSG